MRAQLLLSPLRGVSSGKHLTLTMFFSVIFQFNYHEFMDSWQQSVPEGMVTKSAHLAVSTMGGKQMRRFVDIFYNRNLKFLEYVLLPAISLVSVTTPFAHHQNNNNNNNYYYCLHNLSVCGHSAKIVRVNAIKIDAWTACVFSVG